MANRRHTKEGGDDRQEEGEGVVVLKKDVLDCPVCSTPLSPPIFQCKLGHLVCSPCRDKLPGKKKACSVCSKAVSRRCHAMERVVESIVVPCSNAAHGCTAMMAGGEKAEHEEACPHAPCFCPEQGCGFAGTTEALLNHFDAEHEWPVTAFKYAQPFDVPVKAGMHVLHGSEEYEEDEDDDSDLFLLHVGPPDTTMRVVSLVRVQAHAPEYDIGCSASFSWFRGQTQVATLDTIQISSLSSGVPDCRFCIVPEAPPMGDGLAFLSVTIDVDVEDDDEQEEADDEEDESEWMRRMAWVEVPANGDDEDDKADDHNDD
ncbi:hypothetical protein CFC21_066026 [Triticum aestivum]|uniref:RING-type E3 ubiquitin transferase n=2 Tax=Triticum aestivum TaxID=4565 RepID=A0A9R1H654_WHEAT|nr:E3 ubiquitin-protein ligase SINA-like 2 [Triticum aestivum]KAF7059078.1 hypothetical protein CFC21_066026 [Triticum aestivum]